MPTVLFPTFDDFSDSLPGGYSFTNFNEEYSGITFDQFTTSIGNTVPQGFGEVPGSRIRLDDAVYRVRSSNITPDVISIEAEYDTLFSDLNDVYGAALWENLEPGWTGLGATWTTVIALPFGQRTFTDFNTTFASVNFKDFALLPMREVPVNA